MATSENLDDPTQAAHALAEFVRALRAIDPNDGPRANRGAPLRLGADKVRRGIAGIDTEVDTAALLEVWDEALAAPEHPGPPTWYHGDLAYLNVLAVEGHPSAVIDWGSCGVGDPAIDLLPAWSILPAGARDVFREEVGADDAEWARAKGWVVTGVFGIPYYRYTNPVLVADKIHAIEAVLEEA